MRIILALTAVFLSGVPAFSQARDEVRRWNRILTAEKPTFHTEPNAFLVEMGAGADVPGKSKKH